MKAYYSKESTERWNWLETVAQGFEIRAACHDKKKQFWTRLFTAKRPKQQESPSLRYFDIYKEKRLLLNRFYWCLHSCYCYTFYNCSFVTNTLFKFCFEDSVVSRKQEIIARLKALSRIGALPWGIKRSINRLRFFQNVSTTWEGDKTTVTTERFTSEPTRTY